MPTDNQRMSYTLESMLQFDHREAHRLLVRIVLNASKLEKNEISRECMTTTILKRRVIRSSSITNENLAGE